MNILNERLDIISHQLGWQSWESENNLPEKGNLGPHTINAKSPDNLTSLKFKNSADITRHKGFEEQQINTEISTKIYELLESSGKPTPYHDLTKALSKDYPGYNYDFFPGIYSGIKGEVCTA